MLVKGATGQLGINFSVISIKIKVAYIKLPVAKWWPFCLCRNMMSKQRSDIEHRISWPFSWASGVISESLGENWSWAELVLLLLTWTDPSRLLTDGMIEMWLDLSLPTAMRGYPQLCLTAPSHYLNQCRHYSDVIMNTMGSQITCVSIVSSPICSGVDQRKHQSSVSLAFVRGIHR